MISDDLKQISSLDDKSFSERLVSWIFEKMETCKNNQELKTLLYQIDFNWDTIESLKKGGFRKVLGVIYENDPHAISIIEKLTNWKL